MKPDKLEQLKKLVELVNQDTPSKKEVVQLMSEFVKTIKSQKQEFTNQIKAKEEEFAQQVKQLEKSVLKVKGQKGDNGQDALPPSDERILSLIKPLIPKINDGTPGVPGKDSDPVEVAKIAEDNIVYNLPKYGERIRDGLELLDGNNRLDKRAIKGIEEIENEIKKLNVRPMQNTIGGLRGFFLFTNSTDQGLIQYLNLIPGTNVTITHAVVGQRHDVTINSSGGGSASFINNELVGIGDNNTTNYTLASTPVAGTVCVYVGGLRQTLTTDYTNTGTAIAFTFKVPSGLAIIADYQI